MGTHDRPEHAVGRDLGARLAVAPHRERVDDPSAGRRDAEAHEERRGHAAYHRRSSEAPAPMLNGAMARNTAGGGLATSAAPLPESSTRSRSRPYLAAAMTMSGELL